MSSEISSDAKAVATAKATTQKNPAQEKVIATLPGPLFVSAGAGSGKTWTLTQRIGGAFLENEQGFKLNSISEVLAITFTKKAAAELLSRIKAKLIEVKNAHPELDLSTDDINVDASWISTIHGFCSRFLKENALEIGLDPDFQMLSEIQSEQLQHEARELVLKKIWSGEIDISCFKDKWRLLSSSAFDEGLIDCAEALRWQALGMRNGFDDIKLFCTEDATNVATSLISAANAVLNEVKAWPEAPGKIEENEIEKLNIAINALSKFTSEFDISELIATLGTFPKLDKRFGQKESKGGQELYDSIFREPRQKAFAKLYGLCGTDQAQVVINVAKAIHEEFDSLKRKNDVLDDTDLLRRTLEALDSHPELQEKMRDTFKLIMIDEFQDTDKVQVAILERIAAPRLANVCVVGDAQQSIYRFRGADVNTFFEYYENLKQLYDAESGSDADADLAPKLERNYRSHADVLDFVECIFSRNGKFIGTDVDFLKLDASGTINQTPDPVMDDRARITLDITHADAPKDSECGLQALVDSANRIAEHFAEIKDAYEQNGEPKQSFALLLGKTKFASVYINAFRRHGLESVMTAGSLLMSSDEAQTMLALMRLAINKNDELPLFSCLTSELFAISDDSLMTLSYSPEINPDTNSHKFRGLAKGFWSEDALKEWDLDNKDAQAHELTRGLLSDFVSSARSGKLSYSIRKLLADSGYIARMNDAGVHGLACVGNYAKLLDILSEVENDSFGVAETINAFEAKAKSMKESPGVLTADEADFVQIMTIHGSKGLEFDHVAVADFGVKQNSRPITLAESVGNNLYVFNKKDLKSIRPDKSSDSTVGDVTLGELVAKGSVDAADGGLALEVTSELEGKAELRRLLYVAFTRAVKSLYVSYRPSVGLVANGKSKISPTIYKDSTYDGIFHEIYDAVQWEVVEGSYVDVIKFGEAPGKPLQMQFNYLTPDLLAARREIEAKAQAQANIEKELSNTTKKFMVPVYDIPQMPVASAFNGVRENVSSYTSLAHDAFDGEGLEDKASAFSLEDEELKYSGANTGANSEANSGANSEANTGANANSSLDENLPNNGIAVNLGSAFHLLAQRSILEAKAAGETGGNFKIAKPTEAALIAKRKQFLLTDTQFKRLQKALDNYFASPIVDELCSYDSLDAEVPFLINVSDNNDAEGKFLEGAIDALATSGENALVVDYKTGTAIATETLKEAYKFQASCYALALFERGYKNVKATFVRVERPSTDNTLETYTFEFENSPENIADLRALILKHWK